LLSEAGTGNHSQARSNSTAQRAGDIDRYVALGDSYTSGAGIPLLDDELREAAGYHLDD
jgi:hypothetical protein